MKRYITRRIAVAAVGAVMATAVAVREIPALLTGTHYKRTPYDDLLASLDDREAARSLGRFALKSTPEFDQKEVAQFLRARLRDANLKQLIEQDVTQGRTVEVAGWVLPNSFALICALAAAV